MSVLKMSMATMLASLGLALNLSTANAQITNNNGNITVFGRNAVDVTKSNGLFHISGSGGGAAVSLSVQNITSLSIIGLNSGLEVEILTHIDGDVTIRGGIGTDDIFIVGGAAGNVSIETFAGNDTLTIDAPIQLTDMVQCSNFDDFVDIDMGDGRDTVEIEGRFICFNDALSVETGRGYDVVRLVDCNCELTLIGTGDGRDSCLIQGVYVSAPFFLAMGSGNDSLNVINSEFAANAFFNGNSGTDWKLTLNNSFWGMSTFSSFEN